MKHPKRQAQLATIVDRVQQATRVFSATAVVAGLGSVIVALAMFVNLTNEGCDSALVSAGTAENYPTFSAVGLTLPVTGDSNGNATAWVEWKTSAAGVWQRGVDLVRISGNRFAGSVMWLNANTSYDVRPVLADPDGVCVPGGSQTIVTRNDSLPTSTRTIWAATNGSPTAPAPGTPASPLSLQNAVTRAQPGDEVRLLPGVYSAENSAPPMPPPIPATDDEDASFVLLRNSSATQYVQLIADGPGVIFDGANPLMKRPTWTLESGSVYWTSYDTVVTGPTYHGNLAAAFIEIGGSVYRLYQHASLSDLVTGAGGITQGLFYDNTAKRLYVRLEDGLSPALTGRNLLLPLYEYGVYIAEQQRNIRVSGIEFRYFGVTKESGGGGGIRAQYANQAWIDRNTFHDISGRAVFLRVADGSYGHGHVVEDNTMTDSRVSTWPWAMTKGKIEEKSNGVDNRDGRGVVIRRNTISGTFDGITIGEGGDREDAGQDNDVYQNTIRQVRDDSLETDGISAINLRVHHNAVDDVFSGISFGPITQGPEYFLYNTFRNFRNDVVKLAYGTSGHIIMAHNSMYTDLESFIKDDGEVGYHFNSIKRVSGPVSNFHAYNNILFGKNCAVSRETGEVGTGNDLNGNFYYVVYAPSPPPSPFCSQTVPNIFMWNWTQYVTVPSITAALGFEAQGKTGNPNFVGVDEPAPNFGLSPGSPAIDAAIRMPGINDVFQGPAPDIGAVESVGSDDSEPPVVSVTSPAAGTVSGTITVSASATDNVAVEGVQFKLDNVELGAEDTSSPYEFSWNTTSAANGPHFLTAVARDARNHATSAAVAVTVNNLIDTTPPVVSLQSPPSGAVVFGATAISADATDNVGVAGVQFRVNGANHQPEVTAAPYGISWDTVKEFNGTYVLSAVCRDTSGNSTTASDRTVTVQNPSCRQKAPHCGSCATNLADDATNHNRITLPQVRGTYVDLGGTTRTCGDTALKPNKCDGTDAIEDLRLSRTSVIGSASISIGIDYACYSPSAKVSLWVYSYATKRWDRLKTWTGAELSGCSTTPPNATTKRHGVVSHAYQVPSRPTKYVFRAMQLSTSDNSPCPASFDWGNIDDLTLTVSAPVTTE